MIVRPGTFSARVVAAGRGCSDDDDARLARWKAKPTAAATASAVRAPSATTARRGRCAAKRSSIDVLDTREKCVVSGSLSSVGSVATSIVGARGSTSSRTPAAAVSG